MHELETAGVELNGEIVKESLLYLCGDNLSSHQIGGFHEHFSSGPIFRFCMATKDKIDAKWKEHECILRTKDAHARHVELIKTEKNLSNCYGVTGQSCRIAIQSLDASQGLPAGIRHALFEGVIFFVMKHVIKRLIDSDVFTLEELNKMLISFQLKVLTRKLGYLLSNAKFSLGARSQRAQLRKSFAFFATFPSSLVTIFLGTTQPMESTLHCDFALTLFLNLRFPKGLQHK
ncbi:hypothetical protein HPB48_017579 [Haemaphysalis longicornis]|uniref:Uncharacterized protein n=1 Tax=Haemaphysalis longicornis TaxID=44386 RepID=A0A9J6GWN1_HAELO|nr:hypothetical protein HPB48_017579 [Haemaphysalis longicornis]